MRTRSIALAATALSVTWCGIGRADDAEDKKALEQKLAEMQKQIDEMSKKLSDGANHSEDELEQRVAELEKITKKDQDGLFAYWGNGLRLDSTSGAFKLQVGGRIQSDWTWFQHTTEAEGALGTQISAGEEFRRARLMMAGQIYDNVAFSNEYDFAGGTVNARDVWIALKKLPFTFQVGNFKEPTGTEELTSDLFIPFLERSGGNEAFAPDYKTGFMVYNTQFDDRLVWQACMTRNSNGSGNSTGNARSGEYNFTGRLAGKPWSNEEGTSYLTVGVAGSIRAPQNDKTSFSAHPELHIGPKWLDTKTFGCDREDLLEMDAGFIAGPFWAYADYFNVQARRTSPDDDVTFDAWSVCAGYFITGEVKPYKASNSSYDRIKPKKNFDGKGGWGAWEVAARYDELDLNDGDIQGGKQKIFTAGLSWYLNPNTRWMLDWVHAQEDNHDIWINGIEMRFQIDF
jgi:phosphate-selective porin OprO/OprP